MTWRGYIGDVVKSGRGDGEISSFAWRIPDYLSLAREGGDRYESPAFDACDGRWCLHIYPRGLWRDPPSKRLSLILYRLDEGPSQTLDVILGIRGAERVENKKGRRKEFSKDDRACFWFEFCSRPEFSTSTQKSVLMPGDMLIVNLDMKSVVPSVSRGQQSSNKCVICLERSVDTALYRCGHMYTCYDCALKLWKSNSCCPMCRKPIQDILKIYSDSDSIHI